MGQEKVDSNKRGWLDRWRERRAQSKLRAVEIERRRRNAQSHAAERHARAGGGPASGG